MAIGCKAQIEASAPSKDLNRIVEQFDDNRTEKYKLIDTIGSACMFQILRTIQMVWDISRQLNVCSRRKGRGIV